VALTALLLGPALGSGYVLAYDMVWVPHLAVTREALGLGTALPRAVPSDAVVGVLDHVLPAVVLQKLALAGALLAAGTGATRLVGEGLAPRLAAVSLTIWSPFTVERLWMGHWPVLLGYAVVPWLAAAGRRAHETGRLPWQVWLLLPLGSLNANAGIVSAAVLLAAGASRRWRPTAGAVLASVAANAPWIVSGLLHAAQAQDATGYGLFGLHGDALPAPLAALTLGGIWNRQVVPGSRLGAAAWVATAVLVALAALGARRWWRRLGPRQAWAATALWLAGYLVAVLSWAVPGLLATLGGHLPGLGLLRDGTRSLALCLPAFVGTVGAGVEVVLGAVRGRPARIALATAAVLAPVAVLPDAAWGIGGVLRPAHYPAEWSAAREAVDGPGEVLLLPFSAYRAPSWNGARPVLDPLGRYLGGDYVADDDLVVSGETVAGEDPLVPRVAAALALASPSARERALEGLGIGWVATERDAPGPAPAVAGTTVHRGLSLEVVRLPAPRRAAVAAWRVAMQALAWIAFILALLRGVGEGARRAVGRWRKVFLPAGNVRREREEGHT